jgi:hypothetical protein
MDYLCLLLFILVVTLQAGYAYLTWRVLAAGGRELNPIMRFLIQHIGTVGGLAAAKLALIGVVSWFLLDDPMSMLLVAGLYAWVVVHNRKQLKTVGPAPAGG